MGDPSSLRYTPASSASTPIDWTRIPEASKKILLDGWGYNWENDKDRSLPETVGDLAKMFDESKFFGYMHPDLCMLLMDISEFGLKVQASGVPPRFYMKYMGQVWFILFLPGKRDGISGYSRDVVREDSDDSDHEEEEDQRMVAKEIKLAQEFDLKLMQEFSPDAADIVDVTKKLCGWDAWMLRTSLESMQSVLETLWGGLGYRGGLGLA